MVVAGTVSGTVTKAGQRCISAAAAATPSLYTAAASTAAATVATAAAPARADSRTHRWQKATKKTSIVPSRRPDGPLKRGLAKVDPVKAGRLVWKLSELILEHLEELAELKSWNNGKPLRVARAADVPLAADLFHYMAGWATEIEGNTIPLSVPYAQGAKYHAYTLRKPVGVVGQIYRGTSPC